MSDSGFNLLTISKIIFKKKNFIILLAVIATVISGVFCFFQTKRYTSQTVFIVKDPFLLDRSYVFGRISYDDRKYFAIPDDVDHIKSIAKRDNMIYYIIKKFDMVKLYGAQNETELVKKVKGNFKAIVEDTRNVELSYTDADPQRAAAVVNEARSYIEETMIGIFMNTNKDMVNSLKGKMALVKDTIKSLDSSIANLRASSGIYTQLLPSRGQVVSTSGSVSAGSAQALEQLQEITTLKDKLNADMAEYQTIINEYEVLIEGKPGLFQVVQDGYVPNTPSHPQTILIVLATFIGSIFFGILIVLVNSYYKTVMHSQD